MSSELPAGCVPFDEDLSALIDEELSPEREAEVRAHLDVCDRCARQIQELCNVDLALASLPTPAVALRLSRGLAARTAAVDAPTEERPGAAAARSAPPSARRRWLGGPALSRIAVAAGVALAAWLVLRGGESLEPAPPIAQQPVPEVVPEPAPVPDPAPEEPVVEVLAVAELPAPPAELSALPEEDLQMLLEIEGVEDFDLIANLELLETLVDLELGAG